MAGASVSAHSTERHRYPVRQTCGVEGVPRVYRGVQGCVQRCYTVFYRVLTPFTAVYCVSAPFSHLTCCTDVEAVTGRYRPLPHVSGLRLRVTPHAPLPHVLVKHENNTVSAPFYLSQTARIDIRALGWNITA